MSNLNAPSLCLMHRIKAGSEAFSYIKKSILGILGSGIVLHETPWLVLFI